jgi:hypothetical protein
VDHGPRFTNQVTVSAIRRVATDNQRSECLARIVRFVLDFCRQFISGCQADGRALAGCTPGAASILQRVLVVTGFTRPSYVF